MFIHLYRSDLVTGYDRIREAQSSLPSTYRDPLLKAYSLRMAYYNQRLRRVRTWKRRFKPGMLVFSLLLVMVCGSGFWLSTNGDPTGLVLFCLAGMLGLVFTVFSLMLGSEPRRPENPLGKGPQGQHSRLHGQLFPDLTGQYLRSLAARVPGPAQVKHWADQSDKHGLIGEFNLVRALSAALPQGYFILHGLMQNFGDDLDVMVVGPSGVWLFEVKYLNAQISFRDGVWTFRQFNHKTGRIEPVDLGEPPDLQWLRMRDEVRRTLAFHGRELVKQVPALGEIQGGIVFSHQEASYDIEPSPPFAWGRIPGWVRAVKNAPPRPLMTLRVQLQFLDLLLKRHQILKPAAQVVSMADQADRQIAEAKGRIEAWVRGG